MSEGASTFGKGKLESAQYALDELRKRSLARCNRFEQAGLTTHWVVIIGELYKDAEYERMRKSLEDAGFEQPIGLAIGAALVALLHDIHSGTSDKEQNRVRDAIVSGGSDPSSPAPTQDSYHSAVSHAATRARIEEGLIGI